MYSVVNKKESSRQVLAAFFVVGAGVTAQHIGNGLAWRNFLEREFAVNVLYLHLMAITQIHTYMKVH